ncbi:MULTISPECIES: LacI family DNA-binding transcriptional regulator [unclassified Cryobacterium]|uniref:LacI family DNA-binding transcriptional regulator n=1 Tax=unclassified Cryobacterium TaxID=2649013 RepID=UPI002AB3E38D|nr:MULTISPECIES: LacI family DNA-binding transcriptional regulator [Cryobacterium]MDY7529958.1 LacI family DNA-binding transcriptional regulator [Cryobacterium sp. 10C2]MDY7544493.1 LacI family DNA-binding transcriptional regulator [Cryobacterium sp. 5B3]MDY7557905.1 LacI family DNA-binding transcriptional regulator [Cryobacterium sp. 10C3]MEB0004327.1 LacI family DNA-binding transcriptional regulator [Cryobacterium sp. RTC2.1]MEB0202693.1 LacI family DNA-binding transcriptional regulator [Cry
MTTQARATLADVARLADVSSKTVSRVFSGDGIVSAVTRERVLSAAKRLRFRPNVLARSLRHGGVSNTVAFVIGDITNPFYFHVAAGIERELADNGLTMVLSSTDDSAESEEGVVDSLLAQRVRALLLIPIAADQSYLDGERQLGTPIVSVDRPASNLLADSVVLQNREGMREAVRSLIKLGHRKIGFVSNPSAIYTLRERLAGYREALAEAGIADNARYERCNDDPAVSAESAVASLFDQADPPTALVTGNNRASSGALRVLRGREPRVAFIGFDDFDLADALDITVVAYDTREIGRAAARLALDRLEDPTSFIRQIEIPTRLIHRGSGEISPPT